MTKEQAIKILDQAVATIQTTRQNHEALIKALQVISSAVSEEKTANKE